MGSILVTSLSQGNGKTALLAVLGSRNTCNMFKVNLDGEHDSSMAELGKLLSGNRFIRPEEASVADSGSVNLVEGDPADHAANIRIAEKLDASVVAVMKPEEDAQQLKKLYGDRLAGVILNKVPRYKEWMVDGIKQKLAADGIKFLGWLPEDRTLISPELGKIVELMEGQYLLGQEHGNKLIKSYLLGGLVLDWGPFYFTSREDAAVIVRGDRPDVQLAALQAGALRALILTKGVNPIEYVYYEARTLEVPLITVKHSTEAAARILADTSLSSQFSNPEKLEAVKALAQAGLDLDALDQLALSVATR